MKCRSGEIHHDRDDCDDDEHPSGPENGGPGITLGLLAVHRHRQSSERQPGLWPAEGPTRPQSGVLLRAADTIRLPFMLFNFRRTSLVANAWQNDSHDAPQIRSSIRFFCLMPAI